MRILFLSNEYPPHTDGIGAYVSCIAPALAERGHDVHVLSCVAGQEAGDLSDGQVAVHRRDLLRGRRLSRILRAPAAANRLWTAASCWVEARRLGLGEDVVEAPDWMAEGLGHTLRGAPVVAHLHTPMRLAAPHAGLELGWNERFADWLERASVARATLVTAPSQLLVDSLRRAGWLRPAQRVDVIRYPVDLQRWAQSPPADTTEPVVLVVGRLERRKAPEAVIDACARLQAEIPGLRAVFVGRGDGTRDGLPYRDWVEARARERGVACELVEHIPRDELPRWYASARVVAVPSRYDNFPMVTLEAMASRRAVVCSAETGSAEILAGSGAGAVTPVGDAGALADALRPYLADPQAAARAGDEALALVTGVCAPARVAEQREACYGEAVAAG